MWLYNAWADRVEGHVSFTKTMKREEGCGKGEGQRGKRGKDISRGQTTCNIQWVTNCWVCNKTHSKNKNNLKDSKKTTQMILLCSVWESVSVSTCAYHETYLIMSHKNVPQKPEADSDPWYPAPPRPSKNTEQPRSHNWMTTVCSLKEYKNNYQCQKIFTNIICYIVVFFAVNTIYLYVIV